MLQGKNNRYNLIKLHQLPLLFYTNSNIRLRIFPSNLFGLDPKVLPAFAKVEDIPIEVVEYTEDDKDDSGPTHLTGDKLETTVPVAQFKLVHWCAARTLALLLWHGG